MHEQFGDWQSAIENFNMEHRARQYILKQAQTANSTIGYIIPFSDDSLVDIVQQLPFQYRVHNKLNRLILKKRNPALLAPPMAATLISAHYPIIIQEVSRGVRVVIEEARNKLGLKPLRLGWFDYEHLYEKSLFHDIIDSLQLDLWNKQYMHEVIHPHPRKRFDAGSLLDMLCKIKTVDYYLSPAKDNN